MGLLSKAIAIPTRFLQGMRRTGRRHHAGASHACRYDQLENRRLLAINVPSIHVGSVYLETDAGNDNERDEIRVTFAGGAPGTQLTRLEIDGDKEGNGLSAGDIYFDTAAGGLGVFASGSLIVAPSNDFVVTSVSVADGSTKIVFEFSGFEAGETLIFYVDVDERGFDPSGAFDTALAEGGEFAGTLLNATFTAPHFEPARVSTRFLDDYDQRFAEVAARTGVALGLPPDRWPSASDPDRHDRTAGAAESVTQVLPPVALSGYVYHDRDNDGLRETGEEGIGGVQVRVELVVPRIVGYGFPAAGTAWSATTGPDGFWKVEDLVPGEYRVLEVAQPSGYLDGLDRAGSHGGQALNPGDRIEAVVLGAGDRGQEYNFGEILPSRISGRVHADLDGDCEFDEGESPLSGVVIELLDGSGQLLRTTQTSTSGNYEFRDLPPGTYMVREIQPAAFLDGAEHVGSAGGTIVADDTIGGIVLRSGTSAQRYDFCEHPPATIAGRVWVDANGNNEFDQDEEAIPLVTIQLIDESSRQVVQTTQTSARGEYVFERLTPGLYTIREIQPAGFIDGGERSGSLGGNAQLDDVISQITVRYGDQGLRYDFWELRPASLSGRVFVDADGDGTHDPSERLLSDVQVDLLDATGAILRTTRTNQDGRYHFDDLAPGKYAVREHQPEGYIDGGEAAGSVGGIVADDFISQIMLMSGTQAVEYNFWEYEPSLIAGRVHIDLDGDCVFDPATEQGLPGVTIQLLRNGQIIAFTLTDAEGRYSFNNLPPGVYGIHEIQPPGYFDDHEMVGTAGGEIASDDLIVGIALVGGTRAEHYDFCERLPSRIEGIVFHDANDNGLFDEAEPIPGVTIELLDASGGVVARTATGELGAFAFEHLAPGTYTIREVQPAGYIDSGERAGPIGGTVSDDMIAGIVLISGTNAAGNEFWELRPAGLHGVVHEDLDDDCALDEDEAGIAGVSIELFNATGDLVATTYTDSQGQFYFDNLRPGVYTVREIQPPNYFHGGERVGTAGGVELGPGEIGEIRLGAGVVGRDYIFCEEPPAALSGHVFQDGPTFASLDGALPPVGDVFNGRRTPDDAPIAGVIVQLLDQDGNLVAQTLTDAEGRFHFGGLRAGVYSLVEIQPSEYHDWIDTPGSLGGSLDQDAFRNIVVPVGRHGVDYDFSELRLAAVPLIPLLDPPALPERTPIPAPLFAMAPPPLSFVPPPRLPGLFYGSDGRVPYSWHLSVINSGTPRGEQAESTRADAALAPFTQVVWRRAQPLPARAEVASADESDRRGFGFRDGIPVTGDFNGDGITEFGMYYQGDWYIDLNANGIWDEGDLFASLGGANDRPVTGDWDGDGKTDIGIFGPIWPGDPRAIRAEPGLPDSQNLHQGKPKNVPPHPEEATDHERVMQLTARGTPRRDLIDHVFFFGQIEDIPIVGDLNGDGVDTIGVFRDGTWYIDQNGDGRIDDKDRVFTFGQAGDLPIVGDFDGNGIDEVGVYRRGVWYIDANHNFALDENDRVFHLGGDPADVPVVGDWNGDGKDEPGIYQEGDTMDPPPRSAVPSGGGRAG